MPEKTPYFTKDAFYPDKDRVHPAFSILPEDGAEPRAIILALHGFVDHIGSFREVAEYWAKAGIGVFSYDQLGFGGAPFRGHWQGADAYIKDAKMALLAIREEYPDVPLFLLGESMGGAIAISASCEWRMAGDSLYDDLKGVILVAPAVWGGRGMGLPRRYLTAFSKKFMPALKIPSKWGPGPGSDNEEMLEEFFASKEHIANVRCDMLAGLVSIMKRAQHHAENLTDKYHILYGENEKVVPRKAIECFKIYCLPENENGAKWYLYEDGWHMLLRDYGRKIVWYDIVAIVDKNT